ncbi:uncharacterized protein LOC113520372 [Galleria mellonella]|uniref:Uncharacterized protein LOC113520372 n=1 Tax=Galleria mellonella TaxID=7137 RepID=A0ABM3MRP1_GALME|nr:uncharacterized protein LOC113520372 [Galleria mellonella]
MSQITENYINNVINLIISDLNLVECHYSQIKFESIAQNYFGVLIPVILTGKNGENEVTLDIVLKIAPTDERFREKKPVAACLIDYQTVRMSSPAYDTLFFIITSTQSELRHKHYQELLDIYYQTFNKVLKEVGLDSHTLYSKKMLYDDLKIVAPACFIVANTALWLSNGLQQEGHVRSKNIWTTDEEKEMAVNKYKSVIKNILDDFVSYGYFSL